jgi:hypothetical protein
MEVLALSSKQSAEMTTGGIVSGNYFDVYEDPNRDRARFPAGGRSGGGQSGNRFGRCLWRRRFGADTGILGSTIELNRIPFTIIGIAPRGFMGVYGGLRQDFWISLHATRALDPHHVDQLTHGMGLQIIGRPKPGASLSGIQSELSALSTQLQRLYHKDSPDYRAQAYPLHEAQRGFHSSLFELVRVLGSRRIPSVTAGVLQLGQLVDWPCNRADARNWCTHFARCRTLAHYPSALDGELRNCPL